MNTTFKKSLLCALCSLSVFASTANAAIIQWADWKSGTTNEVLGEFVTPPSIVDITYTRYHSKCRFQWELKTI